MLVGISLVRDEMPLLPLVCAHLLRQGVERLIIADHQSLDGTREWLAAAARRDSRILFFMNDAEEFHQAATVTALARIASALGATWVVPFDADEFWTADRAGLSLRDAIRAHENTPALALLCRVRNFIADRETARFEMSSLERVRFAAPSTGDVVGSCEMQQVAALRRPFVLLPFGAKVIFRARPDVWVRAGAHSVGVGGDEIPPTPAESILCGHLPIRSRSHLVNKARHGETLRMSGYDPAHGWQEQIIADADATDGLDDFWSVNSMTGDRIEYAGASFTAEADDTLRKIYREVSGDPLATLATTLDRRGPTSPCARPMPLENAALEAARSLAIELEKVSHTAAAVQIEAVTARGALSAAQEESRRDKLAAEQTRAELAAVLHSRTWRWTSWIRRTLDFFRLTPPRQRRGR